MPPAGLIFDFDGTLVDTMPIHWEAWTEVAHHHHFHLAKDRFYALAGIPSRDIIRVINQEQQLTLDPHQVGLAKENAYLARLDQVKPIEAILQIVRAHLSVVPMAVATGGSRRVVHQVMDHLQLRQFFPVIVTNEDVQHQKPAPDLFLEAARRLGVRPERCRAYEDADLGLQAIRAAGMEAVDVRALCAA